MLNRKGMLTVATLAVGAFFAAEQAQAQQYVATGNWNRHSTAYSRPAISTPQFAAAAFRSPAIAQNGWAGRSSTSANCWSPIPATRPTCSTPVITPRPTCSPPRVIQRPRQVIHRRPVVYSRPIVQRPVAYAPRPHNSGGIRISINW